MNCKKILAIILSAFMMFSLTSCKGEKEPDMSQDVETTEAVEILTEDESEENTTVQDELSEESTKTEETTENEESTSEEEKKDESSEEKETEKPDDKKESDYPADWSKEKIVEEYKKAAKKSNSGTKTSHEVKITSISVNNGQFEGFFDFIMSIMSKFLANNTEDKDGITGGYNNLTAADVKSAKAYKVGDKIAIELVMNEQVSGMKEDANSGSVGHAITTVGDISDVVKQFKDLGLPLELNEKDTKIYYTNPTVKVLVNSDGKIVNGTWKYTVEIRMNNYKAFGKKVDTTSIVMDNILTVNGGFKK